MSFTVKVAVLAAVALSEIVVAGILAPRFLRQGNPVAVAAIAGSGILTVAALAYVLFFVIA